MHRRGRTTIRVACFRAGLELERHCRRHRSNRAQWHTARNSAHCLVVGQFQRIPTGMVHNMAHGKRILGSHKAAHSICVRIQNPKFLKLWKIFGNRIIKVKPTLLDENGNCDSAKTLRLRALHKSIVKIDRPLQFDICITGTCNFLNAIVVEHADDTGKDAFLYIRSHSFCGKMGARIFNIFGRSAPNNIFRSCTPCNICGSSDSDCTVRSCNINNNIFGSCTPDK